MTDTTIIQLQINPANLPALEEGINVDHIRLQQGDSGVYGLHIEGAGTNPLPVAGQPPT